MWCGEIYKWYLFLYLYLYMTHTNAAVDETLLGADRLFVWLLVLVSLMLTSSSRRHTAAWADSRTANFSASLLRKVRKCVFLKTTCGMLAVRAAVVISSSPSASVPAEPRCVRATYLTYQLMREEERLQQQTEKITSNSAYVILIGLGFSRQLLQ